MLVERMDPGFISRLKIPLELLYYRTFIHFSMAEVIISYYIGGKKLNFMRSDPDPVVSTTGSGLFFSKVGSGPESTPPRSVRHHYL